MYVRRVEDQTLTSNFVRQHKHDVQLFTNWRVIYKRCIVQGFGSPCYEGQIRTCMLGVLHFGAGGATTIDCARGAFIWALEHLRTFFRYVAYDCNYCNKYRPFLSWDVGTKKIHHLKHWRGEIKKTTCWSVDTVSGKIHSNALECALIVTTIFPNGLSAFLY